MKTILFVEDDTDIVQIYRESLLREGFDVRIAEDGLEAMRSLHTSQPDLVILDLMMPKFNGLDVLKNIRANPVLWNIKVVIFSNDCGTEIAVEAEKIGADAFLLKFTCTPEQLVNTVKTLLLKGQAASS